MYREREAGIGREWVVEVGRSAGRKHLRRESKRKTTVIALYWAVVGLCRGGKRTQQEKTMKQQSRPWSVAMWPK